MKLSKSTKWVVITIGALSILAGICFLISGKSFEDYWLSFFSGVALIGTALINEKPGEVSEKGSIIS